MTDAVKLTDEERKAIISKVAEHIRPAVECMNVVAEELDREAGQVVNLAADMDRKLRLQEQLAAQGALLEMAAQWLDRSDICEDGINHFSQSPERRAVLTAGIRALSPSATEALARHDKNVVFERDAVWSKILTGGHPVLYDPAQILAMFEKKEQEVAAAAHQRGLDAKWHKRETEINTWINQRAASIGGKVLQDIPLEGRINILCEGIALDRVRMHVKPLVEALQRAGRELAYIVEAPTPELRKSAETELALKEADEILAHYAPTKEPL